MVAAMGLSVGDLFVKSSARTSQGVEWFSTLAAPYGWPSPCAQDSVNSNTDNFERFFYFSIDLVFY